MITSVKYLKPNITIETEIIKAGKVYVYNYQGVHYRVFNSLVNLHKFMKDEIKTWDFECDSEKNLEKYLYR